MNVSIKISSSFENGQRAIFWNDQLSHHIHEPELQSALQEARREFWKTNATRGAELGGRVFGLLNGSGGQLETALRESYQTGAPLNLALDIPFELDALPFELLYSPPLVGESLVSPPLWGGVRGEVRPGFLVLNDQISLVRRVNNRNRLRNETPAKRMLTVLFMACSPRDLSEREVLNFEREEESVFTATEKCQVTLTIEDSGSLSGLQDTLTEMGGGDVLHLTGHAGIDATLGPVFYMENDVGDTAKVTPEMFWNAIRKFPPRIIFISGCATGKSDKVNAAASFAWQIVEKGVSIVLGWGLPVADAGATLVSALAKAWRKPHIGRGRKSWSNRKIATTPGHCCASSPTVRN